MSNQENENQNEDLELQPEEDVKNKTDEQNSSSEPSAEDKLAELNDKYLRLYSEFENFRRRTAKEKLDLMKTAAEDVLADLLPVLDDFERAIRSMNDNAALNSLQEGVNLVYHKFVNTLQSKGLKPFQSLNESFDPELHEAVTKIPAPSKKQRGKIVDELEKGYKLNDKVIRYAKVVVGE